jgi:hypothetical protein
MVKFTVNAGQRVGIDLDRAAGSTLNSFLRLFDAQGNQLHANDDAAAPGESTASDSYLEFVFALGGTYYVGVSGSVNSSYDPTGGGADAVGSTGAYTLRIAAV